MVYSRLASSHNPFVINLDLVRAIQEIVDIMYLNATYKVWLNDRIFSIVGQTLRVVEYPLSFLYVFR